ncbi:hypothetical protein [Methylovorus glucosotrophus]|uniref:Uncharacterized protein n=1 Tax=Methylovorus glucosotrophus (strain SIP3-4) TaxID=582744 RepID=C6X7W2_METGS|nr:hypothetical protein [Methylovorus glucosotrophus]ACT51289.1 hypothetical protein Msip34_2047 [Methylovorus glucosotrophus SIP3-4]
MNKFLKTKKEVKVWLDDYEVENYTINNDLTVMVDGDVNLGKIGLTVIPVKFNYVSGDFFCDNNELTSLEFAPKKVDGCFYCSFNKLKSLKFAPEIVGAEFACGGNQLTSLEFSPKVVGSDFYCDNNQLTSLKFAPENINGIFGCYVNELTSLEFLPKNVSEEIYCINNPYHNDVYNQLKSDELKIYLENEKLSSKLQAELPKQDDFSFQANSKQLEELHAQILERNKTVEIPDTYITEANKPKEEVKELPTIAEEIKPIQTQQPIVRKLKL